MTATQQLAATPDAIVALRDVTVAFGAETIYDRMTFSIEEGEFLCIVGPSGCGKSTLLRVIGDLLKVDVGAVEIAGRPASENWREIAYVFQSPRLLAWRDALENVVLAQQLRFGRARSKAAMRQKARELLELVGLSRDMRKMPAMLSGGERQRVAIARALSVDPRIILMDEPFSALDINTRARMQREIIDIWKKTGKTVVFVTHDIDEAIELADRIVTLSPKPASVIDVSRIDAPRPRNHRAPEVEALREHLKDLLARGEAPAKAQA